MGRVVLLLAVVFAPAVAADGAMPVTFSLPAELSGPINISEGETYLVLFFGNENAADLSMAALAGQAINRTTLHIDSGGDNIEQAASATPRDIRPFSLRAASTPHTAMAVIGTLANGSATGGHKQLLEVNPTYCGRDAF